MVAATRGVSVGVGGENVRWRNQRTGEERKGPKEGTGGTSVEGTIGAKKRNAFVVTGGVTGEERTDERKKTTEEIATGGRDGRRFEAGEIINLGRDRRNVPRRKIWSKREIGRESLNSGLTTISALGGRPITQQQCPLAVTGQ
eukprot:jgi/Psemu1/56075/gm1.56075_g